MSSNKQPISMHVKRMNPMILCADGFTISIQASSTHYCKPRNNEGPYTHVECGYPSGPVSAAMMEYADEPDTPTESIYAYVPSAIVEAELALHGGIVN